MKLSKSKENLIKRTKSKEALREKKSPHSPRGERKERERDGEREKDKTASPVSSPRPESRGNGERHREETRKVGIETREKSNPAMETAGESKRSGHAKSHDGSKESEGKPAESKKVKVSPTDRIDGMDEFLLKFVIVSIFLLVVISFPGFESCCVFVELFAFSHAVGGIDEQASFEQCLGEQAPLCEEPRKRCAEEERWRWWEEGESSVFEQAAIAPTELARQD